MSKNQTEQDAQMKEAIKKELASFPVKTQSQRDDELVAQINALLAGGPAPISHKTQADRDAQMKEAIKKELARVPVSTQSQRGDELKAQIKAQLAGGPASMSHKSQADRDAQMKEAAKKELSTSSSTSRAGVKQRRNGRAADYQVKAQTRQTLTAFISPQEQILRYSDPGPSSHGLPVDGGVDRQQVGDARARRFTTSGDNRPFTSKKGRPRPEQQLESERVGAFPVATRAHGEVPAWIRQQAQQNRRTQRNDDSNLPPEIRGLTETPDQSDVPPEMRMAVPPHEPTQIDVETLPLADVAPVKAEVSTKKENWGCPCCPRSMHWLF